MREPLGEVEQDMFWNALFANFAVVALAAVFWTSLLDAVPAAARMSRPVLLGLVFGAAACASMATAIELRPGLFFDLRATLLALAGLFGGLPAAVIAAAGAALFRLARGGDGMTAGVAGILTATLLGWLAHRRTRRGGVRRRHLPLLGAGAGLAGVPGLLLLPHALLSLAASATVLPSIVFSTLGVTAAGLVILQDQRRREAHAANATYRAIIEALPDSLNVKDRDGRFLVANPATARLMRAPSASDLIGRTDFAFYPAEIAEAFRIDERRALEAARPTLVEQRIAFADGASGWLSTLKTPLPDETGRIVGLVTHNRDITETKALQDALALTQSRLDGALAHMADGFALFDREGVLLLCNGRYGALFPLTADLRVPGGHLRDILRASVERGERPAPAVALSAWVEARLGDLVRGNDSSLVPLSDGRWIEFRTVTVGGVGSLAVVADVTGRQRADEKLRAAEAEYRTLFENAVCGIYRSSPEGRMLRANPALVRLNGYGTEEELVRAVGDIGTEWYVDPSRRAEFARVLGEEGRVTDFVSEIFRHGTRERIWVSETAWAVCDANGALRYYEGTVVDANERKRAEAAVGASEARFRLLADNAADFVVLVGPDGRCRFASPASRELLGREPDALIGQRALSLVHVPDRPRIGLALMDARSAVSTMEFRAVRADGALIWVEAVGRPLAKDTGTVLAIRDISVRKQTEAELADAMRQLEALASTDALTGLASRRTFDQTVEREFARCARERLPLSLLLIDVDHFKAFNDTYGHPAGDACLQRIGAAISASLRRAGDVAARYGGEEMVAILPNTDEAGAATLAAMICKAVRGLDLAHAGSEHGAVTVSVGAATQRPNAAGSAHELVSTADRALYAAKRAGRNQTISIAAA